MPLKTLQKELSEICWWQNDQISSAICRFSKYLKSASKVAQSPSLSANLQICTKKRKSGSYLLHKLPPEEEPHFDWEWSSRDDD